MSLFSFADIPPQGLKLMELERGQLQVAPEGGAFLRNLPSNQALNLLFIFGNARSGKSFLLNCLAGHRGLFKVVKSAEPCTKGADISSFVTKPSQLLVRSKRLTSDYRPDNDRDDRDNDIKSDPLLAFIDVEGQGAEDGTYDTLLALPLLLTSKIVLFNHKGAPTVHDMLSKLGVLARAADYVELGDDEQNQDSSNNNDNNDKPPILRKRSTTDRSSSSSSTTRKFGHLHVIFRDFSFEGDTESVYNQLMGEEPLLKIEKKPKKIGGGGGDSSHNGSGENHAEINKSIQERNDIRHLLLSNFASIHVHLFKQPSTADNLRSHQELPESLVDTEFIHNVANLSKIISKQARSTTLFGSSNAPLTGAAHYSLLCELSASLNKHGNISVPSVYRAMEKDTLTLLSTTLFTHFQDTLKTTYLPKFPMNMKLWNKKVTNELIPQLLQEYDDTVKNCPLNDEKSSIRADLLRKMNDLHAEYTKENEVKQLLKAKTVISTQHSQLKMDIDKYCSLNMPLSETNLIEKEFFTLQKKALEVIKSELSDISEIEEHSEYKQIVSEFRSSLHEFLILKSIQNDSALKDAALKNLREEMIKQQEVLVEQNKKLEKYVNEEKENTREMEAELQRLRLKKIEEEEKVKRMEAEIEKLKKKNKCVIL